MNGYYIQITNNLLEKKHVKQMGSAVWLFMWVLDRMTSVNENGVGKVLGGKPITYEEVEVSLGMSRRTYSRWLDTLREAGYIETTRTPAGNSIKVNKAKKSFGGYAKSGTSVPKRDVPKTSSDMPNVAHRYAKNGTSNIRQYKDNTKTIGEIIEKRASRATVENIKTKLIKKGILVKT
jgi:DNA-binding transcriptional ArsR family regulator